MASEPHVYTITRQKLDKNFVPYLTLKWAKKSKGAPSRDFVDDPNTVDEAVRKTKEQKSAALDLMLGQIAKFCPIISRNTIIKNSTSLDQIWQVIRLHFGFQSSGGHFLDFSDIRLSPDEKPEDLYQRLMAFIEDNLLKAEGGITHEGEVIHEDEELTPTIQNLVVITWLRLIHPALPKLIKQRYGTELRSRTLASIKLEISQALPSLLEEIQTLDDAKVLRSAASNVQFRSQRPTKVGKSTAKRCPLCKEAGRRDDRCKFLPDSDKQYLAIARHIIGSEENDVRKMKKVARVISHCLTLIRNPFQCLKPTLMLILCV